MWEAVLSGGLEGGRGGYDIRVSLMLRSSSNSSNDLRERERERERETVRSCRGSKGLVAVAMAAG